MGNEEKPTTAFVLSLIGAIFILIGAAIVAAVGAIVAVLFPALGLVLGGSSHNMRSAYIDRCDHDIRKPKSKATMGGNSDYLLYN